MQIQFTNDFLNIKKGTEYNIQPNTINYVVGMNGSGKSVLFSTLSEFIHKKVGKKVNWMVRPPDYIVDGRFNFTGFESITDIVHITAKTRQSMWVDFDMCLDSFGSVDNLRVSEGLYIQNELKGIMHHHLSDTNTLFIFDEVDSCLDLQMKCGYFTRLLQRLLGTCIVITHDSTFIGNDQEVFDVSSGKLCKFVEYFDRAMLPFKQ